MVALVFGEICALVVRPQAGLALLWQAFVPALPLCFLVAPGYWRNICPLATLNQLPRRTGRTRALGAPALVRKYGYLASLAAFVALVALRQPLLNGGAPAVAFLLGGLLLVALLGGYIFRGKSGWCTSFCPLLPVERLYGQSPFVHVPDTHCTSCIGCTPRCVDAIPRSSYLIELYAVAGLQSGARLLFAALFPGFVLAYFAAGSDGWGALFSFGAMAVVCSCLSAGALLGCARVLKLHSGQVTALAAVAAVNIFYFFVAGAAVNQALASGSGVERVAVSAGLRIAIAGCTLVWLLRALRNDSEFRAGQRAPASFPGGAGQARNPVWAPAARFVQADLLIPLLPYGLAPSGRTAATAHSTERNGAPPGAGRPRLAEAIRNASAPPPQADWGARYRSGRVSEPRRRDVLREVVGVLPARNDRRRASVDGAAEAATVQVRLRRWCVFPALNRGTAPPVRASAGRGILRAVALAGAPLHEPSVHRPEAAALAK